MENRKYKVDRDNIYVGQVGIININKSWVGRNFNYYDPYIGKIDNYGDDNHRIENGELFVRNFCSFRSTLFSVDKNGLSNDLLYNSPHYPILNTTEDNVILQNYDKVQSIIIRYGCSLSPLLEYYNFPLMLGYYDILKIIKLFFFGSFVENNIELFGGKIIKDEHYDKPITEKESIFPLKLRFIIPYLDNNSLSLLFDNPAPSLSNQRLNNFSIRKYATTTEIREENVRRLKFK